MDAIKKKMEKLANETNDAEKRIAQHEDLKAANEKEAEKYEEQLRINQKKIQNMENCMFVLKICSIKQSNLRAWRRKRAMLTVRCLL